ncbi:MAG: glycosyltransferase [Balneolales bacterium]|nr:glycosyltransferase [Balneolales bacterium]
MNPEKSGSAVAAQGPPLCCVVFVFYNQEHEVEPMLQPFLEAVRFLPLQVFIYDDGSTDGTPFVVESLIEQAAGDHVVFHKHDLRRGTGMCLNLALEDSAAKAFYFVDKHFDLNIEAFGAVLKELSYSNAAFTFPASNPALDPTQLAIRHAHKKKVPASINFIIRKDRIRPDRLFFNPFLQNGHSSELLMRAGVSAKALEAPTFFHLHYNEETYSDLTTQDSRLIMFHSQLSSTEVRGVGSNDDPDLLYEKAEALKSDGRIADALDLCEEVLERFPRHQHTLKLSVELLQRLKKYIKASERRKLISQGAEADQMKQAEEQAAAAEKSESEAESEVLSELETEAAEAVSPSETEPDTESERETETENGPDEPEIKAFGEKVEAPEPKEAPLIPEKTSGDADTQEDAEAEERALADLEPEETEQPETEPELRDDDSAEPDAAAEEDAEEAQPPVPYERPAHFRHSIIVPIAGFAQPSLEKLALCLYNFCEPSDTELIIIDNACIDDSWEYLKQMEEHHFFHLKVITNRMNKGFTQAVNQGLKAASGEYTLVMHADVTFETDIARSLADVLEANPEAAIAGPVTTQSMQEEQVRSVSKDPLQVLETAWIDGFCFVMRAEDHFRLDERYRLAWYETIDLCCRMQEEGKKVLIAAGVFVKHASGVFTSQLGVPAYSDDFVNSLNVFSLKWGGTPELPEPGSTDHPLEEIWLLGGQLDMLNPSKEIQARIKELLDDKLETELKNIQGVSDADLRNFIRAMMAVNNRGLMRDLEERLSGLPDPGFGFELLRFYFKNQIFSRCKKYITMIREQQPQLALLYALRIAWKENDIQLAPQYLAEYLEQYPAASEAYYIGAKMHEQQGNTELAETFMERAHQLDPFTRDEGRMVEG